MYHLLYVWLGIHEDDLVYLIQGCQRGGRGGGGGGRKKEELHLELIIIAVTLLLPVLPFDIILYIRTDILQQPRFLFCSG